VCAIALPRSRLETAVDLSLVICTRNRRDQLRRALDAVARVRATCPWELVVVDNGSTDGTSETINQYLAREDLQVRTVQEATPGLGRARNAGLKLARGRVVAFTDDDCYPAENYVDAMVRVFEDPPIAFAGGRILLFDPADFPITIQTRQDRVEIPPNSFIPAGLIQGANFAVRREVLLAVDGFDPRFGAGTPFACEDVDVLARLSAAGYSGAYDPRPLVYHHHGRQAPAQVEALSRTYDIGRGAYYAKCLCDKRLRNTYLVRWAKLIARQELMRTLREIRGAIRFLGSRDAFG